MEVDFDRWRRLLLAEANAKDDGPDFATVQAAGDRRARARDQLARFKANDPQGHASGPPLARAHPGDRMLPGVGGTSHDDITRAFETGVRELEARVTADRLRECSERRNSLSRLVEEFRRWAAEQTPPVMLPGDDRIVPPLGLPGARSVHLPAAPPDFLGRVA